MYRAQVFAQTTREMPEWVTVLKQFQNVKAASFLLVAWFMGFGIGLIFTFLFWHLQVTCNNYKYIDISLQTIFNATAMFITSYTRR